jgi:phosphohistidine phosphatase SixA
VNRRALLALLGAAASAGLGAQTAPGAALGSEAAAWAALREGAILLLRHANAPGGGDPAGLQLGDCSTQRNLDDAGRDQARRIGERLRQERVPVGAVWASPWCRTRETAELLQAGAVRDVASVASFFGDRSREPVQTAAARDALRAWRGPGALVVVTHQVNITALTGVFPASGEGVVLRRRDAQLEVVGRLPP